MEMIGLAVRADGSKVPLVSGLFELYDTYGLHPADAIIHLRTKLGGEGSLVDFYAEALIAGWTETHIEAVLGEVLSCFESPAFRATYLPKLIMAGKVLFMERLNCHARKLV